MTANPGFFLSPYILLRVNQLPAQKSAFFSNDLLISLIDRRKKCKSKQDDIRCSVIEHLHEQVSLTDNPELSRFLLQLKRDIYNKRQPKVVFERFAGVIEGDPVLQSWYRTTQEIESLTRNIEKVFHERWMTEKLFIRQAITSPSFMESIVFSSRELFRQAMRYASSLPSETKTSVRKLENTLIKYIARAAGKTSPFSRYTSVALLQWGELQQVGMNIRLEEAHDRVLIRINHSLVQQLLASLFDMPEVKKSLKYRLCRERRIAANMLTCYISRIEEDKAWETDVLQRKRKKTTLSMTPAIQTVFQLLERSPTQTLRFDDIVRYFALQSGVEADQARRFVLRLIDLGVLESTAEIPDQAEDILQQATDLLQANPNPLLEPYAAVFQELQGLIRQMTDGSAAVRQQCYLQAERSLKRAFAEAGISWPAETGRNVFYEDTLVRMHPQELPLRRWDKPMVDLKRLLSVASIFDPYLYVQESIACKFVELFGLGGVCKDVDELEDLIRQVFQPDSDMEGSSAFSRFLFHLRRHFLEDLASKIRLNRDEEIILDPHFLEGYSSSINKQFTHQRESYGLFVQPFAARDRQENFVVNHIYTGLGQFISRYLPLFEEAQRDKIKKHIRNFFDEGDMLVEIRAAFGFNANLHPPMTQWELKCNEVYSERPEEELVGLDELMFVHDPKINRVYVRHKPTGKRVRLLYFGFLVPFMLPDRLCFLQLLEGNTQIQIPIHQHIESQLQPRDKASIRFYPRISIGDGHVILYRKRWHVPADRIPLPESNDIDANYMIRLLEWCGDHSVPHRTYIRKVPILTFDHAESSLYLNWEIIRKFNYSKPQYFDLSSNHFVRLFVKLIKEVEQEDIVFEEVLPEHGQSIVESGEGGHVNEWIVELNKKRK
ncbi:lantibiotic dehydratase [Paenibacillus dendritiformis]|uniref:lantibiotic dehydratase n=1 Tax=Paenibacillus dendritiformis TaxID=130049 RepID=UPI00365AE34F